MKWTIFAPDPALANDIADVARIFYGPVQYEAATPEGGQDADVRVRLTETQADGRLVMAARADGAISGEGRFEAVLQGDALERKRVRKRAAKLAVYRILRTATGVRPPWGALTGIRPTRLVYQRMEGGASLDEALDWLGDTFDVTESRRALLRETVGVQQTLPPPRQDQAEIYVGIPFCVTRCAYCSFSSGEIGDGRLTGPYMDALIREIDRTRALMDRTGLTPSTVYIGGGTPTSLPFAALRRLMQALAPWTPGREFTVEAGRPDTIDRDKLRLFLDSGVTRISVNPQSFHDVTLQRIGRAHTAAQTVEAYALARAMGFNDINMDLIAGLPGEDEEMFRQSLAEAARLGPDSLTVHSLAIKHASTLHLYGAPLPDGAMTARMVEAGADCARRLGLRPYYLYRQKYMAGALENVAYARPGAECLYNVRMMEETGHVLALGAGAISKRVAPAGGKIVRAPNVGNIEEYIRRVDEMAERKETLWSEEALPTMAKSAIVGAS